MLADGKSNKEIAGGKCFLSEGTIRNYISGILDKLNLRDRTQLQFLSQKLHIKSLAISELQLWMKNIEKKKEKLMMQSFVQYTPTKVVFGKATQKEAGKLVSELEITKVLYMAVEVQSIQQKELR